MSETAIHSSKAQRWLHGYCERQARITSAVVLLGATDGTHEVVHWPESATPSAALLAAARATIKRPRALVLTPPLSDSSAAEKQRFLSAPLVDARAALAVALTSSPDDTDEALLRTLEQPAATLAAVLQGSKEADQHAAGTVLQLQASLLGARPIEQAASALTSELATNLGFERVSLGLLRKKEINVIALSHNAELGQQQALIRGLAAAMQEAIDQGVALVYPSAPDTHPRITQAHAALATQAPGTILSVPLVSNGITLGALCFERDRSPPHEEIRAIERLACVLAPVIALKQRAEQSWVSRAHESLHACWSRRTSHLAWASAVCMALLVAFVPMDYRVGAPARLEAAMQRVLVAPTDGYLHAARVRPGDVVKEGQLLAELAQQDLLLEIRKWEAELNQHENTAAAALARADRAQYALAQARAAEARSQLELARARLARTQLRAPIEGIVIKGDLSQALGAPVQRGEVLLTLAPRDAYRLMIEVDERDIGAIALGQHGQLALSALPGEHLNFTVKRISPVAVNREGRNVFEVEAAFDRRKSGLRPGLEGVAKIKVGSQPLVWIATHRVIDWLKLELWRWTG